MYLCQSRLTSRSQFPSSLKGKNRNIRTVQEWRGRGGREGGREGDSLQLFPNHSTNSKLNFWTGLISLTTCSLKKKVKFIPELSILHTSDWTTEIDFFVFFQVGESR